MKTKTPKEYTIKDFIIRDVLGGILLAALAIAIYILA